MCREGILAELEEIIHLYEGLHRSVHGARGHHRGYILLYLATEDRTLVEYAHCLLEMMRKYGFDIANTSSVAGEILGMYTQRGVQPQSDNRYLCPNTSPHNPEYSLHASVSPRSPSRIPAMLQ